MKKSEKILIALGIIQAIISILQLINIAINIESVMGLIP